MAPCCWMQLALMVQLARDSIDVHAELWGALLFWRSPKAGARVSEQGPAFTFQTQRSPIQLR